MDRTNHEARPAPWPSSPTDRIRKTTARTTMPHGEGTRPRFRSAIPQVDVWDMSELVYIVIPVVFVAGALLWFRHLRAQVHERQQKAAMRRNGQVRKAPWILYPRLVIPLEAAEAQISCMHGGRRGGSARTFAWVGCSGYPDLELRVRRWAGRVGALERMGWRPCQTGDRAFDQVFWQQGRNADAASDLLDADVRNALLAFDAQLAVHLSVATACVYRDGWQATGEQEPRLDVSIRALPPHVDDVERLIEGAQLAHASLLRRPLRMSA